MQGEMGHGEDSASGEVSTSRTTRSLLLPVQLIRWFPVLYATRMLANSSSRTSLCLAHREAKVRRSESVHFENPKKEAIKPNEGGVTSTTTNKERKKEGRNGCPTGEV
jgi:hypothetical protein